MTPAGPMDDVAVEIADGKIVALTPTDSLSPGTPRRDLAGGLLLPEVRASVRIGLLRKRALEQKHGIANGKYSGTKRVAGNLGRTDEEVSW